MAANPQTAELALPFDEREVVLRANLADVDDEGCLWVSLRFMRGPTNPSEGEWVYLLDPLGGGCLGEVVQITGWVARVKPARSEEEEVAKPRWPRLRWLGARRRSDISAVPDQSHL